MEHAQANAVTDGLGITGMERLPIQRAALQEMRQHLRTAHDLDKTDLALSNILAAKRLEDQVERVERRRAASTTAS